jgi:hypothetical protein
MSFDQTLVATAESGKHGAAILLDSAALQKEDKQLLNIRKFKWQTPVKPTKRTTYICTCPFCILREIYMNIM